MIRHSYETNLEDEEEGSRKRSKSLFLRGNRNAKKRGGKSKICYELVYDFAEIFRQLQFKLSSNKLASFLLCFFLIRIFGKFNPFKDLLLLLTFNFVVSLSQLLWLYFDYRIIFFYCRVTFFYCSVTFFYCCVSLFLLLGPFLLMLGDFFFLKISWRDFFFVITFIC